MFSCKSFKIFKSIFLTELLRVPASTVGLHDDYWINFFLGANDGKNSSNDLFGHGLILDKSELIAQRLSAEPKGNSMKYAKQGPREFVPFEYSEVTLENIKRACKVHYRENLTTCDILASEQGPSCSRLDKISSFKVIYVRFIIPESGKSLSSETLELDPFQSQPQHKIMQKNVISNRCQKAFQL